MQGTHHVSEVRPGPEVMSQRLSQRACREQSQLGRPFRVGVELGYPITCWLIYLTDYLFDKCSDTNPSWMLAVD